MTLHLRHGPGAGALQKRALAQVLAKTLFRQTTPATATEVGASAATLLALGTIPLEATAEALDFLRTEGSATANEAGWSLTEAGEKRIASANDERSIRVDRILKARFGSAIPLEQLKVWFVATLAQYFERYGSETVAVLFRSAPPAAAPVLLSDLIEMTARNSQLGLYVAQLTAGFRAIIESPTPDELQELGAGYQAMISAKYIAARVGVDPITSRELSDATVLVDTNVLLIAALEEHRHHSGFVALSRLLGHLSPRLMVLPTTIEEYRRFVALRTRQILHQLDRIPRAAFDKIDDPLIRTALAYGCKNRADFEAFFASVADPPSRFGELAITEVTDREVIAAAARGSGSMTVINEIEAACRDRRRTKSTKAIEHDSAVVAAVERLGANGLAWVLTADHTMCAVAARRAPNVAIPTWVHVTTLIDILAVEQGAEFEAQDFGGILAAMFSNDLQPMLGTYTVDDVDAILEAEERVADLEPRAFEQVGLTVARARVRGEKPDEIQLLVKRAFQHERTDLVAQRDAALTRSADSDRDLRNEREARQHTERKLEGDFLRQHSTSTRRRYLLSAAALAVVGIALAIVGLNVLLMAGTDATLTWVGGSLASTGLVVVPGVIFRRRAAALSALRAGPELARAYVAKVRAGRSSTD